MVQFDQAPPQQNKPHPDGAFMRDPFTWQNYLLLSLYALLQAALGPLQPFLREELALSYTVAGLHMSAFALGMIGAGSVVDRFLMGRPARRVFWLGSAGMVAGGVLLIGGRHPAVTIGGALIMGLLGSVLLVAIQANLTRQHGAHSATALTEANVVASAGAALAPLLIGVLERWQVGWRGLLPVVAGAFLLVLLAFPAGPGPRRLPAEEGAGSGGLPLRFWLYWLVIFAVVAIEWCIAFWGAAFLEAEGGLPAATAAATMSAFFWAMILGRYCGSRLTRRTRSARLLLVALGIVAVGFPLFWLAPSPQVTVLGLFIAGLGIANLFPLALAAALNAAPGRTDLASARAATGGGLAILLLPQLLGAVADVAGLAQAYTVVLVLLPLAVVITLVASLDR